MGLTRRSGWGQTPLGSVLVWVLVVGLVSYAGWRFIQAAFDPDRHGVGAQGIVVRTALAAGGATYLALALFAASAWSSSKSGGGGGVAESLSQFVGSRWAATIILPSCCSAPLQPTSSRH